MLTEGRGWTSSTPFHLHTAPNFCRAHGTPKKVGHFLVVKQIAANVSSSGFTFTFIVTIIISVFVPGRSRVVQTHSLSFCTTRHRPGTKTETIIVTLNVKVNSEEDTFVSIYYITHDRPGTKTEMIVTINVKVNPEEDTFTVICCIRFSFHLFFFVK